MRLNADSFWTYSRINVAQEIYFLIKIFIFINYLFLRATTFNALVRAKHWKHWKAVVKLHYIH